MRSSPIPLPNLAIQIREPETWCQHYTRSRTGKPKCTGKLQCCIIIHYDIWPTTVLCSEKKNQSLWWRTLRWPKAPNAWDFAKPDIETYWSTSPMCVHRLYCTWKSANTTMTVGLYFIFIFYFVLLPTIPFPVLSLILSVVCLMWTNKTLLLRE